MNLIAIGLLTLVTGIGSVWLAAMLGRAVARYTHHMLSLAAGALLATAFIHLLPEALADGLEGRTLFITLLLGVVLFFLLDKAELWHHGHEHHQADHTHAPAKTHGHQAHDDHHHAHGAAHAHERAHGHHGHVHHHGGSGKPGTWSVLLGDSVHCFGDGVLIASAYVASPELGLLAALAVLAHEVPHHMGDLVVLQQQDGQGRRAALTKVSLAGAVTAVGGVLGHLLLGSFAAWQPYFLVIAASSFIYVALADLIPQLQRHVSLPNTVAQVLWLLTGMALVAFTSGLVHTGAPHAH